MLARALFGAQHTELVPIGIGHDNPIDVTLVAVDSSRPEGDQAVYFRSLVSRGGRSDVEMKPVLRGLRGERRSPGDERTGPVWRPDRGLFVLIPDQRPPERCAPEIPSVARTVASDRSEASAVGEEGVVRLDDAELVAFGVGKHDMRFVLALTDVDVAGTELDQPSNRVHLVIDGRSRQIEMDAVLASLLVGDQQEADPESVAIRRHELDRIMGRVRCLPVQGTGPEARETERIVCVEAEGDEPRRHRHDHRAEPGTALSCPVARSDRDRIWMTQS